MRCLFLAPSEPWARCPDPTERPPGVRLPADTARATEPHRPAPPADVTGTAVSDQRGRPRDSEDPVDLARRARKEAGHPIDEPPLPPGSARRRERRLLAAGEYLV